MKESRLAKKIIVTLIKDRIHYPSRLMLDTVGVIARCGVLLILYSYVFGLNHGVINNTTFLFASWSILFYFLFSAMRLRDIARSIMIDIQSGNIEVLFNRPMSYLTYRIWWQVGSGIYSFAIISVLAVTALWLLVGVPPTMKTVIFIPTMILTFFLSSVLSLVVYAIVGLLAFWIEDVAPVFWIVDKAVMILGGSYLPVALFPPLMYQIALYSPFGASQFITHTMYDSWQSNWYQLIGIQLAWIVSLGLVMYFMFKQAQKKVSVNGG